ncbi:MAG: uncharacterized protein QOJ72_2058 [Nocardioidaceae bacterium]|nr:uncharacterized protein [Nocardioidaceae bacterium]
MAELMVDGRRAAPLELADTYGRRRKGLLGREGIEGAFWLTPCRHVHTFGMKFPIDVALVDRRGIVLVAQTLAPGRLAAVRRRSHSVIEAEAGAFETWGLRSGSVVDVHRG